MSENTINITVKSTDKTGEGFSSTSSASKKMALDVQASGVKVEKAMEGLAKAQKKFGENSLQSRQATVNLARAQHELEENSKKLAAAEKVAADSAAKLAREQKEAEKSSTSFKNALREIGKTAAGVLTADIARRAAQDFKNLVTDSVRQASDLNESLNAVNVTFGASAKEITDWGKSNAASFGLSQSAFNAMATPLGAMLKNTGLSMQDTTKWTIDLTKRAADMASVFNTSVPDALEAIQAGLRGESDPLEKYGVGLSAAKVEAEALAETGKKTAKALTTQELATARLNIIMKQTAQTQGDFQNTSDGAANAARIASAQFDNAKASLGNALLPILAKAATAAAALAEGFNSLPGPMQATIVIVGALGTAAVLLAPKIRAAKTELQNLGNGALSAETKLGGLARGAGKVAGALGAMATASALMSSDAGAKGVDTTRKALEELRKSGKDSTGALEHINFDLKNINQSGRGAGAAIETFTGFIAEGLGRGWEKIDAVNQRMQALDASLAGMVQSGNAKEAADDFELLRKKAEEQGTSVEKLKEFFPQYQNALDAAARQTQQTGGATEDLTKKLDEEREALNKAESALLGQRDAMRGLEAAYDDASEAIKKNGKTALKNGEELDVNSEKGRANQAALDGIASAAYKARDAIIEQGGSQAAANEVMSTAAARFEATAVKMGMSRTAAKKLADQLFAIPKNTVANVSVDLGPTVARLAWVRGQLLEIQALANSANVREGRTAARATGGIVGQAATGGIRSNRVVVGEHGIEVVDLPPGSQVHSNPDTMRMGVGRGVTVNVYASSSADPHAIGREVAWAVKTA